MNTPCYSRRAMAFLVFALMAQAALGAEGKAPSSVSGHDCGACTEPPKGKMPILVLTDGSYSDKPFGCYLIEILRSEGLVEFEQAERAALLAATSPQACLSAYDVVLMAEMDLDAAEEKLLREYVAAGGVLIAMRPDADLADLFGIRVAGTGAEQVLQYFALDAGAAVGSGVVETALQYHGRAAEYSLEGAAPLAFLYDDRDTPSSRPAVTIHRSGDGSAVAFAFDLAKSVVLMRQGYPQWHNTEGDEIPGYRPMDFFVRPDGTTVFDPERLPIPQADEKQRFLANIMMRLIEKPLPRMWYLPGMHKTLMVNTGDAESNFGPQVAAVMDACAEYGGCFSVYLRHGPKSPGIEKTTLEEEAAWRAAGHEIGVHMYGGGPEGAGAYDVLHEAYGKIVRDLKDKFGHGSRTARNHSIDWTGWVDMAAIEAEFGTGMDVNFYHYLGSKGAVPSGRTKKSNFDDPTTSYGYFNGTGLPQRFIDAKGKILPIYQATTQWPDEWFADKGMTAEQTVQIITLMFEAAEKGYYSAFVTNIHPPRYNGGGKDKITPVWPHAVWKYCRDKGIPSWSAEMLLDFVEARNGATFENVTWHADPEQDTRRLSFDFQTPTAGQDLTIMIPRAWSDRILKSVTADGETMDLSTETVKGIEYGMFTTKAAEAQVVACY